MLERLEAPIKLHPNCELEPPHVMSIGPNSIPEHSFTHVVREKENFISIANDSKYKSAIKEYRKYLPAHLFEDLSDEIANARTLIHFNFDTTIPEYVNWCLLNITCCYHATEDRCNRRFSNYDKEARSPRYGMIKRAGKLFIPPARVKPTIKPLPDVRKVHLWARLRWQDNLFKYLSELAGGTGHVGTLIDTLESAIRGSGTGWSAEQLRQIAKLRKFARPLRYALKLAKYGGWAATAADLLLGGRVVTGYLAMSYEEPFDTHYAWEVDMILKGTDVGGDNGGAFSTDRDTYSIRTSVFDPERQWKEKELSATMTGSSFGLTVLDAFKRAPNAKREEERAFAGSRFVMARPGPRDWTLSLRSLHSLGGGVGFYHTLPFLAARLHNGKRRTHTTIVSA